jgi:hypothetical protein
MCYQGQRIVEANFERDLQVIEGRRAGMVESDVKEEVLWAWIRLVSRQFSL